MTQENDVKIKPKQEISNWWADNPMTYGAVHGETSYVKDDGETVQAEIGSKAFFDKVDETFYSWNKPAHNENGPFGKLFPYERFRGKKVLEVGCGMGTMAMNWAKHGALMYPADLNPVAVQQTKNRFQLYQLPVRVTRIDGNVLPFADNSFDYVYSSGVLHHSPDLSRSIGELFRVLRPGGEFSVMLYHRNSVLYWFTIRFFEGYLHGESRFLDKVELASRYGDGDRKEGNPHTWPVTRQEMHDLFGPYCSEFKIDTLGTDLDFTLEQILVAPWLSKMVPAIARKPWSRRWGWSLWMSGRKKA